ncbi:hypothetical protein H0H87_003057 [Tephrocybe sp. NHM501043]|nr:hypothetical protein H0H87_003057 [Tephrocybe sp. NHM501043]
MIPLMSDLSDNFLLPPHLWTPKPVDERYIDIDLEYQGIVINLAYFGLEGADPVEDMYYIAERIDPTLPVKVTGFFDEMHWELGKGYRELGELLTILGTDILPFDCWEKLTIRLPDVDLPYDAVQAPALPLKELTTLRHLVWSGHPMQMLNSWFPLSPPLLQRLHTLDIKCNIAWEDCVYIFRNIHQLRSLKLHSIQRASVTSPVIPHDLTLSLAITLHFLTRLSLESCEDIFPLLRNVRFPSLRHLELVLLCTSSGSNINELDNINWENLESLGLYGDFDNSNTTKITSQCGYSTKVETHFVGPTITFWEQ